MTLSHLYDDFGSTAYAAEDMQTSLTEDGLEDVRLGAFEKGYRAGWDDAKNAHEADREKLSVDLAQALQDMSFTYHEAFSKLTLSMQPLLTNIVTKLLPNIAQETLCAHVAAEVSALMKAESEGCVEIAVVPENVALIEQALSDQPTLPFLLTPDPRLGKGQVFLRLSNTEREINLDAMQNSILAAVDAFFEQTRKDANHD
tara:strand:- start:962 stop:1564 length:603 start_codon:yes stop_codon:yes gene_type:complete